MVIEQDITKEQIVKRERKEKISGLVKKVFSGLEFEEDDGGSALIVLKDKRKILTLGYIFKTVEVYDSSYEEKAREIAESYEKLLKNGEEVIMVKDYSDVNSSS